MTNKLLQMRIPEEMLAKIEFIFSGLGLKTNEAVRVFFQQCINENGLPFELKHKKPNADTMIAMQETDSGKAEKISLNDLKKEMGL